MRIAHFILAFLILASILPPLAADTSIPLFDGGLVSSNSGGSSGGPSLITPSAFADRMKGLSLALLMIFIVIASLLVAAGKQGMFLSVITGIIFLFGAGWIVITIAQALGRL